MSVVREHLSQKQLKFSHRQSDNVLPADSDLSRNDTMRNTLRNTIATFNHGIAATHPGRHVFRPSMRFLFIVFVVTLAFDTLSTVLVVRQCGPGIELHPLVRIASEWAGPILGPVCGAMFKAACMVLVVHYIHHLARFVLSVSAILYAGAACCNLAGVYTTILH
jgi:hypothetical protein